MSRLRAASTQPLPLLGLFTCSFAGIDWQAAPPVGFAQKGHSTPAQWGVRGVGTRP